MWNIQLNYKMIDWLSKQYKWDFQTLLTYLNLYLSCERQGLTCVESAHNDGLKTTGRHCSAFYHHERNSFMRNSCFSDSVHVTVSQTGRHMQPMVLDENSVALTAKQAGTQIGKAPWTSPQCRLQEPTVCHAGFGSDER